MKKLVDSGGTVSDRDIERGLPLTEATLFILISLSPAPSHGYAILKEVERLSEGRVRLSTGTLYGALKRLLDQGWIRRVADPTPPRNERPRKFYELAVLGQRVLGAEIQRLRHIVELPQLRNLLPES